MDLGFRLFLALLVVGALYVTLRLLRSRGIVMPGANIGGPSKRRLVVEERAMISAQHGVCIVRVDGEKFLMTFGGGGSSLAPLPGGREKRA
jgi:hypothetical protein